MYVYQYENNLRASIIYHFKRGFNIDDGYERILYDDSIEERADEQPTIILTISPTMKRQIGIGRIICERNNDIARGEKNIFNLVISCGVTLGQKMADAKILDIKYFDDLRGRINAYYYKTIAIPFLDFGSDPPESMNSYMKIARQFISNNIMTLPGTYTKVYHLIIPIEHVINF